MHLYAMSYSYENKGKNTMCDPMTEKITEQNWLYFIKILWRTALSVYLKLMFYFIFNQSYEEPQAAQERKVTDPKMKSKNRFPPTFTKDTGMWRNVKKLEHYEKLFNYYKTRWI